MNLYHFNDIAWHFLIGGDGKTYEGRGWHSIDELAIAKGKLLVTFIGNFTEFEAPQRQLYAAQRFVEDGTEMKYIVEDYTIHAHATLQDEHSLLYNQILLWSNRLNVD